MSTAMGHLLSSSNMIEDYHQSQQDKVQHKRMKALSKETIDLEIFKMGLHGLGKTLQDSDLIQTSKQGIENYQYLQNVDVSNNNLITLKPLGALKHLLMLNASSNKIKKLFDFEQVVAICPSNLQYANYARNEIKQIEGTQKHKYLRILVLDGNQIERIEGLDTNFCLRILSLNQNKISEIQNINHLDLEELYLSENSIKQINGLDGIKPLFHIDLSRNQITHLKGLEVVQKIRFLYLHGNNIAKIKELQYIEQLALISNLDLCFNPIQTRKYYRLQVIFHIPQLRWLDGIDVTPQQKVKAEALHGMDVTDREATFKQFLPEEKFTDRRVNIIEEVDPESDDQVEQQNPSSDRVVEFNDEVVPRSDVYTAAAAFNSNLVAASRQQVSSMSSSIYRQRSTQSAQELRYRSFEILEAEAYLAKDNSVQKVFRGLSLKASGGTAKQALHAERLSLRALFSQTRVENMQASSLTQGDTTHLLKKCSAHKKVRQLLRFPKESRKCDLSKIENKFLIRQSILFILLPHIKLKAIYSSHRILRGPLLRNLIKLFSLVLKNMCN